MAQAIADSKRVPSFMRLGPSSQKPILELNLHDLLHVRDEGFVGLSRVDQQLDFSGQQEDVKPWLCSIAVVCVGLSGSV